MVKKNYRITKKHLSVSCLDGTLNITQVFNQNKKLMPVQNTPYKLNRGVSVEQV